MNAAPAPAHHNRDGALCPTIRYEAMTDLSVIFSTDAMTESQRSMICTLDGHGISRREQARMLEVDVSYIHHVAAGSKVFDSKDARLRYMCSAVDEDQFIENLLAGAKCVSPIPEVPYNGTTDDEVLDGAQAIGQTRFDAMRGDWRAVLAYGWQLINVGWRLVVHAKKMLGQKAVSPREMMMEAPLFDTR